MSTAIVRAALSDNILSPAMRDFWAGMHCLHRYGARCHADTESIGGDNLRVLHDTLMVDPHYRRTLAEAEQIVSHRGLPISRKLFSTGDMDAEIISLQQGSTLRLGTQPRDLSLLMVLSGRAAVDGRQRPALNITQKIHRWLTGTNGRSAFPLKAGAVIGEKQMTGPEPMLSALSNVCVALRVGLSLPALAATRNYPAMAAVG